MARIRLTPSRLVEVRDALADAWARSIEESVEASEPFHRARLKLAWNAADALRTSPAWWVSSDMAKLSVEASKDGVPEVAPATMTGFVVFEDPLPRSVAPELPHAVRAVQWTARKVERGGREGLSVGMCLFTSDRDALADAGVRSLPLTAIDPGQGGHTGFVGDVLRAVWALSSERTVCDAVEVEQRPRAGVPRPDAMARKVKMLVLRESRGRPGAGDGEGRGYSHRFVVRGFWRNQPCGPGHSERRMQWIPPFVKGPADKPLVVKETVRVWRR